jgi:photosystem II stability/assembly factor-like uncharacterized protein
MRFPRSSLTSVLCSLLGLLLLALPAAAGPWRPIGPWGGALADLVVDPAEPDRLFALLGRGHAPSNQSLYRSIDGGERWELVRAALPTSPIERLVVGPAPHFQPGRSRLFALGAGLWTSGDLGATWFPLGLGPERRIIDLAVFPEEDFPLLALEEYGGPIGSNDGGDSWSSRRAGLPEGATYSRIAVDPDDFQQLFVAGSHGVFRSSDGAEHWSSTALTEPVDELVVQSQGCVVAFLRGGRALWASFDYGAHWTAIPFGTGFQSLYALVGHPAAPGQWTVLTDSGVHVTGARGHTWHRLSPVVYGTNELASKSLLIGDPTEPARLWAGFGDLAVLRSEDGGRAWRIANRGMAHVTIHDLALTPAAPAMVQVVARGVDGAVNTLYKSRNGDGVWRVRQPFGQISVSAVAIRPNEFPFTVLGIFGPTDFPAAPLARTSDGGELWEPLAPGFSVPNQLLFDPLRPRQLYARVGYRVWRSPDAGAAWEPAFEGLPEPCEQIWCTFFYPLELEVSPTEPGTLYFLNDDSLHRSRDAGRTWQALELPRGDFFGWLQDLALDPTDPRRLYLATPGGVYQSRDAGRSWVARSNGLPSGSYGAWTVAVVADPRRPGHLLAALADGRLFRSRNGGQLWRPVLDGPAPELGIWRLVAHPAIPHRFLALTRFGGVWQADLVD